MIGRFLMLPASLAVMETAPFWSKDHPDKELLSSET